MSVTESSSVSPVRRNAVVVGLVALLCISTVSVSMCIGNNQKDEQKTIVLYGFSVKGEVFDGKIIPAFQAYWMNKTGDKIEFQTQYAGSGKITNQVLAGAPAEVMILSTEWDALQLKKNGFTTTDWHNYPHNGTISTTPFIILTRDGNPKGVKDFPDLANKDIKEVSADPVTSGGACWSVFGLYGSELQKTTKSEGKANITKAEALVTDVVKNVVSWQPSAREALSQFALGYGDVFITYENDGLLANKQGGDYELVYPQSTIYSEHKVVIVDKNIGSKERKVIEAFIEFLYTTQVQTYFTHYGFRSVEEPLNQGHPEFGNISMPFTVDYLGGWEKAHADLIDGLFTDIKG